VRTNGVALISQSASFVAENHAEMPAARTKMVVNSAIRQLTLACIAALPIYAAVDRPR